MLIVLFLSVIALTAFGNLMVFIAVYTERKLQTTTNMFLISLSIADFAIAALVMPVALLVELTGSFPLDHAAVCAAWLILDVLCCTSSIQHMSAMALDRFLTIKFPLKYGRNKSKRAAMLKLCAIWLTSALICAPLVALAYVDSASMYDPSRRLCMLVNKPFRLYGSVLAFYIPLTLMFGTYAATIRVLKQEVSRKMAEDKHRILSSTASATPALLVSCTSEAATKTVTTTTVATTTKHLMPTSRHCIGRVHKAASTSSQSGSSSSNASSRNRLIGDEERHDPAPHSAVLNTPTGKLDM